MDSNPLMSQLPPFNQQAGECIVAEWSASLTTFHHYYNKVEACLRESKLKQGAAKHMSMYQCPQERLVALRKRMQAELLTLFRDLSCPDSHLPTNDQQFTKQLVLHTRCLNRLNQQAFLLLVDQFPN